MSEAFDALDLDSRASLNSTRLASLDLIEPTLRGVRALELLSAAAVAASIRESAIDLKLEVTRRNDDEILPALDQCVVSPDLAVRAAARRLAERLGRYLGYLLVTLRLDTAAPDTRAYREHLSTIDRVWLGGGLVSGNLGNIVRDVASQIVAEIGSRLDIQVAPQPRTLPLIGAARSLTTTEGTALLYDFGGTTAKHAVATYEGGEVSQLRLLPALRTPVEAKTLAKDEEAVGRILADFIYGAIARDWEALQAEGITPLPRVTASIATYLRDNHPKHYFAAGCMTLRHIGPNAGAWLGEALSRRLGCDISLSLLHDGTSAARTFAGQDRTAVILLGTWLGVGFSPPSQGDLRSLASDLKVI